MKFMLMIMTDEAAERALSPGEINEIVARHMAVSGELRAAGKLVGSNRLCFSNEATTIRVRDDEHAICDGPFAESKEQIGGFYLIEVDSREEAIEWAKKLPECLSAPAGHLCGHTVGLMFWLRRKKLVGSYLFFRATKRS